MIIDYKVKQSRFSACNKSVFSLITVFSGSLFLAGGFFRSWIHKGEKVEDYDIFFTNLEQKEAASKYIEELGFCKVFTCPLGELITFKNEDGVKVQFITKFQYESVKSCVQSFDLTACCCGYEFKTGKIYCHADWLADVKRKTIAFNDVTFPVASIARIVKYHGKGYRYTGETLKHFVTLIAGREFDGDKLGLYVD
jgi:hypothetical protein